MTRNEYASLEDGIYYAGTIIAAILVISGVVALINWIQRISDAADLRHEQLAASEAARREAERKAEVARESAEAQRIADEAKLIAAEKLRQELERRQEAERKEFAKQAINAMNQAFKLNPADLDRLLKEGMLQRDALGEVMSLSMIAQDNGFAEIRWDVHGGVTRGARIVIWIDDDMQVRVKDLQGRHPCVLEPGNYYKIIGNVIDGQRKYEGDQSLMFAFCIPTAEQMASIPYSLRNSVVAEEPDPLKDVIANIIKNELSRADAYAMIAELPVDDDTKGHLRGQIDGLLANARRTARKEKGA